MIRHNGITIDPQRRMVWHRGEERRLSHGKFELLSALLLAGPKNWNDLGEIIYRDHPDAGPLTMEDCIYTQISNIRKIVRDIGLEIRRERHNGRVRWCVASASVMRERSSVG